MQIDSINVIPTSCRTCGKTFQSERLLFSAIKGEPPLTFLATICDKCADRDRAEAKPPPSRQDARKAKWTALVGTRYADFDRSRLPEVIRSHVNTVFNWKPGPRGIGLMGPPRTGKSPLIYALGAALYIAGHDVFPTSGVAFQRQVHRAFDRREEWADYLERCETAQILLIDDADKLNLTPHVEAEYYGMLEHRRNWQRPVLCTVNLTGAELASLSTARTDRGIAIVERLRDLCEFLAV